VILEMVSVIIPVYNEEAAIGEALSSLPVNDSTEVIVVDGGSSDGTVGLAKQFSVKLVHTTKNRALQMNAGASEATGDVLLFLHADTILENDGLKAVQDCAGGGCVGGCFTQKIDSDRIIYRVIEASGNLRAKLSKVFYGDQAIFVRKDVFHRMGGFNNVDLFEDVIFSKKLRTEGKVTVLPDRACCSPRRWEKQGLVRATLINWLVTVGFMLGVSPMRLKRVYRDVR
jgi:rSAM/selenodomain-associated transferase 2